MERQRVSGERFDAYLLRGKYPDVIIGAFGNDLVVTGAYSGENDPAMLTALFEDWRQHRGVSLLEAAGAVIDDGALDLVALLGTNHRVFSNAKDVVMQF